MLENLSRDLFAEQLNTKFKIYFTPPQALEAELVEVAELRKHTRQEYFSIIFLAPGEVLFEQQIYLIEHSELGSFELFLVPVKQSAEGIRYEAVFNSFIE